MNITNKNFGTLFLGLLIISGFIFTIHLNMEYAEQLLRYKSLLKVKEEKIKYLHNSITNVAMNDNLIKFDTLDVSIFDNNQNKTNTTIIPCSYENAIYIYITEHTCSACLSIIYNSIAEYKKTKNIPVYLLYKTSNFRLVKVASNQSKVPIENILSITDVSFLNNKFYDVDSPRLIIIKEGQIKNSIVFSKNFTALYSRILKRL